MRPDPDELIEGIVYTFQNDIMPELVTPWAKRMANSTLWALEHLRRRFRFEHELAVQENAELKALLANVRAYVTQDGKLAQALAAVPFESLPLREQHWPSLRELVEENNRLRAAVDHITGACPYDSVAGAQMLWRELLEYIQRQLEREERLIIIQ